MMDKQLNASENLERLRQAHHQADIRLRELDRHLSLTSEEQIEVARLKKEKLQLKDEIRALTSYGNEM
ncbi:MAG TPA: YdcH family protein [Polyangia bacterium]|jgi:uncharacterized protein YdcH (DUF465 family)|nr:YdcH family protein [Polyangia bacterium]